ncbi:MAG: hypothetical protein Ta2G_16200 [Termitinemataceae bacterium]|nr:MAG: hypothetical protein Ta2G_16200 [Termitinemataceae bacterium]
MQPFSFPRLEHLKKRDDISAVFKKGHCVQCRGAKLFYLKNGMEHNRIAFTFAKKFGNAVARNRARRLGREAYRMMRSNFLAGFDIVLLVYPPTKKGFGLAERQRQFEILFTSAKIL